MYNCHSDSYTSRTTSTDEDCLLLGCYAVYSDSYIWNIALYGAETWTLRKVDQKHLENFEIWCWRRTEKISWADRVRNEEVLHIVKEERNILHTIKRKKG
jgi:hypothetical protein